jgi:V/A-type H+-transporting ATPase subunit K
MGAGIGVGMVGASAIGAISEKPEMLGKTLIYAGLAEGVAIYGIVISIMILGRI